MNSPTNELPLRVFYDGGCPLCRSEIGYYQRLDRQGRIDWCNVAAEPPSDLPLPQAELLARFHAQQPDGRLVSGARAFLEVWRRLPGWRWLALLRWVPAFPFLMELAYRGFLKIRPRLQAWASPR